jgi:single-stranded DNA-binding protein
VNSVCLTGRLISEPASRAAGGQRVVRFRLAVDDAARKPTHVEVECWGPVARSVETYLSKNVAWRSRAASRGRATAPGSAGTSACS